MIKPNTWYTEAEVTPYVPENLKPWLFEKGSMTARLRAHFKTVEVELLSHDWGEATAEERAFLGLGDDEKTLVREVWLLGDGERIIFARTIFPEKTLTGDGECFLNYGSKPLGTQLYKDDSMKRNTIHYNHLNKKAPTHQGNWSRRFILTYKAHPLLITEHFIRNNKTLLPQDSAEVIKQAL